MSAWMAMDRFWLDVMNVGVGLLVAVPLALVIRVALKEWFARPKAGV